MRLEFQLTSEEILDLTTFINNQLPEVRRFRFVVRMLCCILFLVVYYFALLFFKVGFNWFYIAIAIVLVLALWFRIPKDIEKATIKFQKKQLHDAENKNIFDKKIMVFNPDGIESQSGQMKGTIPWNSIVKILHDKKSTYIFINKSQAYIIPKRIFASDLEYEDFKNNIKQCFEASRNIGGKFKENNQ